MPKTSLTAVLCMNHPLLTPCPILTIAMKGTLNRLFPGMSLAIWESLGQPNILFLVNQDPHCRSPIMGRTMIHPSRFTPHNIEIGLQAMALFIRKNH